MMNQDQLELRDKRFNNRLAAGKGKFTDKAPITKVLAAGESEMMTVAL